MMFTEPEVTNCFNIIAYFIFHLKKKKHAPKHALRARHFYNHLAVIIARKNEVLNQSARAIFDNHQCNFTNGQNCIGDYRKWRALTGGELRSLSL